MNQFYRLIILVAFLVACSTCYAQHTLILQPDAGSGKDALIQMRNSNATLADSNYGSLTSFEAVAWTWNGDPGLIRSLLQFDLSLIPQGATIIDARLSLFNNPNSSESNGEQSSLSGPNIALLQRITSNWDESTVTWNNQPATTTQYEVILPQSSSPHEDYLNIDVVNIVTDMLHHPTTSFGFMIEEQSELYYRSMIFASSDHPNCNLHPKLVINYEAPEPINTIILKPDDQDGKDALIQMRNNDPTIGAGNNGNLRSFEAVGWTWSGDPGIIRSLIEFDLSAIPASATVLDAKLSLYNDPTSAENNGEHSSLSGTNESVLQRITNSWDESTVTWDNQPATTNIDEVILAQSTSVHQDYLSIDVTAPVNDMVRQPLSNFGFMIKLSSEQFYRAMIFASSDHPECNLHPGLQVTYSLATGINEIKNNNLFNIYPNPGSGEFMIKWKAHPEEFNTLQVSDNLGKVILENKIEPLSGKAVTFNLENIARGIYYVMLTGDHYRSVQKLIIE